VAHVSGFSRKREGAARSDQVRLVGNRHHAASDNGADRATPRHRLGSRALQGSAQTPVALLGGHIDAVADGTSWAELVNTRRLRLLVTWGAQRTANWPNTPTLREIGIDLTANAPYGLAGPKGMDPMVVASLHDAFRKAMDDPSYREALRKLGQEPFYLGSGDYAAYVTREIANQERLIKQMGLKPE
jgi:tripartite-type tricarboxylate transporter receptor subunit TctC